MNAPIDRMIITAVAEALVEKETLTEVKVKEVKRVAIEAIVEGPVENSHTSLRGKAFTARGNR